MLQKGFDLRDTEETVSTEDRVPQGHLRRMLRHCGEQMTPEKNRRKVVCNQKPGLRPVRAGLRPTPQG